MARFYPALEDRHRAFIAAQHLFFTASGTADSRINLSPKGMDSLRVLSDTRVAYLDLTGSGVETIAHLRENGRLTIMFCGFEGKPRILRLFGRGEAVLVGDDGYDDLAARFPPVPGARSVIRLHIERIQSSCGYAVPFMEFERERETLEDWAAKKSDDGIAEYQAQKNATSIDGLPGVTR